MCNEDRAAEESDSLSPRAKLLERAGKRRDDVQVPKSCQKQVVHCHYAGGIRSPFGQLLFRGWTRHPFLFTVSSCLPVTKRASRLGFDKVEQSHNALKVGAIDRRHNVEITRRRVDSMRGYRHGSCSDELDLGLGEKAQQR